MHIVSNMNGFCLDVASSAAVDGSAVVMNPCERGRQAQQWTSDASTGRIHSALNHDFCLDAGTHFNCSNFPDRAYCNPDLSVDARLDDLVPRVSPA